MADTQHLTDSLGRKTIALVGMMGSGKTTIGKRLARRLDIPFFDADSEIEKAAGRSVADIFDELGEKAFRDGEQAVIKRLLDGPPHVLATGGGAFANEQLRAMFNDRAVTIWLKADLDLLMDRVSRRNTRPLLKTADPEKTMAQLMKEREPIYAKADIVVESCHGAHGVVVNSIIDALEHYYGESVDAGA